MLVWEAGMTPGVTLRACDTRRVADVVAACQSSTVDVPLGWPVLEEIKLLLRADVVTFMAFDTVLVHVRFSQFVDEDDLHGQGVETPEEASTNPFWTHYWSSDCSYPDRSGDYTSVTKASDFADLCTLRARSGWVGADRELRACLPGRTSGQHYRFTAWRIRGSDFTERERFLMTLLRPHLAQAYACSLASRQPPTLLTKRQLEIMRWVRIGMSNLQIAHRMTVSEGTVRTHLQNIYARLDVQSRTAAVDAAFGVSEVWPTVRSDGRSDT